MNGQGRRKRKFNRIIGEMIDRQDVSCSVSGGQKVTDSQDRYCARHAAIPGCFLLWDEISNSSVYGTQLLSKSAVEAYAQRLNEIYRQFLKDAGRDP
jgi:hypothetical protein